MSGRRTLLVIASALVAALGTALVWLYVQGADARAQSAAQASVDLRPVQVLSTDADAGTAGSSLKTVTSRVPPDLASGALAPGQVPVGRLVNGAVTGTILRQTMLTTNAVSEVAKGKQAASITIAAPQRVPALLKKGDDVAVYSYGAGDPTPRLELDHATVRDVGPDPKAAVGAAGTGAAGAGGVPPEIVTFEGPPAQMIKILAITTQGRTAAILINGEGAQPVG